MRLMAGHNLIAKRENHPLFVKKAFYICRLKRRNGRVVECTGLENRRGSHLRGFESLFLRKEKLHNCEAFLFSEISETCFDLCKKIIK